MSSTRVFQDQKSFEVSTSATSVEFYLFESRDVMITTKDDAGWDSQRASFNLTAEEATQLKQFLIEKGY
jgi:hypothetical protein